MSTYLPEPDAAYFNGRSPGHLPGLLGITILDVGQGFLRPDYRLMHAADYGLARIGHCGFFKPQCTAQVWPLVTPLVTQWLDGQLSHQLSQQPSQPDTRKAA